MLLLRVCSAHDGLKLKPARTMGGIKADLLQEKREEEKCCCRLYQPKEAAKIQMNEAYREPRRLWAVGLNCCELAVARLGPIVASIRPVVDILFTPIYHPISSTIFSGRPAAGDPTSTIIPLE